MFINRKKVDTHIYEAWPFVNGPLKMMLKMTKNNLLLRWKN